MASLSVSSLFWLVLFILLLILLAFFVFLSLSFVPLVDGPWLILVHFPFSATVSSLCFRCEWMFKYIDRNFVAVVSHLVAFQMIILTCLSAWYHSSTYRASSPRTWEKKIMKRFFSSFAFSPDIFYSTSLFSFVPLFFLFLYFHLLLFQFPHLSTLAVGLNPKAPRQRINATTPDTNSIIPVLYTSGKSGLIPKGLCILFMLHNHTSSKHPY